MIFQFGQHMADKEKERGRLFSIQVDGSASSVPFVIKKDKLLIGRGDSCEIRIYVDGVAHEHCSITFNEEGRGFVESVNKCGLTYLNGELIERQVSLEHNDVITVVKRSFRFYYPTSSKFYVASEFAASFEDNMVKALADFEMEDVFSKKGKDAEKRVTFGPRLSPEEFDKRMPPASPLRKGSLPREKFKAKTPSFEQDVIKAQFKKNLFMNSPANKVIKANVKSATPEMPESSVVLRRLNYSNGSIKQDAQEEISKPSRPLFSEIVKKSVSNPTKNTVQNVVQKYSPQKFLKKTKLKDSRKIFYKSPRRPVNPRLLAVGSTGHANSPETIVICKKRFNPNSPRNPMSLVKRRKSLRLLQEKVVSGSESHISEHSVLESYSANENIEQNDNFSQKSPKDKTPGHTPKVETRKSLSIKRKINDENKDDTPPSRKSMPLRKSISTPSRKSINTPARKSISTPARKSVDAPARKSVGTPARKSIGSPARKSIGTPAKRSIGTPARKSIGTPAMRSENEIPNELDEDEVSNELDEDEVSNELDEDEVANEFDDNELPDEFGEDELFSPDGFYEDEIENDVPSEEVSESVAPPNSSSLVAAINNVAQIDENNLDRSLNDIQNIVQALSCRSNVPSLGTERLTADMCMNAVKKLALTISMINAFHMYNRIIDDVSTFPLCFPSTSFESNRESLRRLPRASRHQNDDNVRMSRFQDIMQTFFSSSASNQRRRLLRTSEDSPDTESPLSNKKPRRSSGSKMSLRAIDSGHKTPTRKSTGSHISSVSNDNNDIDESNHSEQSSSDNECVPGVIHSKSPRTSISNREKNSANASRVSVMIDKDISFHSPSLHVASFDDVSSLNDLDLQKSKGTRKSSASGKRQSTGKSIESMSDSSTLPTERQNSLEHKKSPYVFKSNKIMKTSPKISEKEISSLVTTYSKMLRKRSSNLLKSKQPKVSLVAKKIGMTTSKKLKAQKKEQKHRSNVLKKVKYSIVPPKIKILRKSTQKSSESLRTSLKGIKRRSDLVKPKIVRLSQKILKKAKSKKRPSSALRLSGKFLTSPKDLKKYGKRKSVVFRNKGIKSKKLSVSSRLSSQKRKSTVGTSSAEIANKRTKQSRSVKTKSGVSKKSDVSVNIKRQSVDIASEKITSKTRSLRKRKMPSGKLNSPLTKKRSNVIDKENDASVDVKNQSVKDSEKNVAKAKTKNQRKKRAVNSDLNALKENSDELSKENGNEEKIAPKPASKNQRKRKAATENISENKQPEKRLKTPEKSKNKGKSKPRTPKTRGKNTHTVSDKKNKNVSLIEEVSGDRKVKSSKTEKIVESKVESPKLKKNTRSTRQQDSQYTEMSHTSNEKLKEVNDNVKIMKKERSTKRKQKIENKLETPKLKKNTRSTRQQDSQDSEISHTSNEDREVNAHNKKPAKRSKTAENKKNKQINKHATSPSKKNTRTTRRKNVQTVDNVENKETSFIDHGNIDQKKGKKRKVDKSVNKTPAKTPLALEVVEEEISSEKNKKTISTPKDTPVKGNIDQKKERKRKVDKSVNKTPAKTPLALKVVEEEISSEKNKKTISTPKDTPVKGRRDGTSKRGKVMKKASPVQRVQRSLRSRK